MPLNTERTTMQRRELLLTTTALAGPALALGSDAPPVSSTTVDRGVNHQRYLEAQQYRSWLTASGIASFFGSARGAYIRLGGQPRDGQGAISLQALNAFQVPYPPVEWPSGHVVIAGHSAGYAFTRCYAVLQGWSHNLVMVGLLHEFSGRSASDRQKEFEAAQAASAAMGDKRVPLLPYRPRDFDPVPTLTIFTKAGQALIGTLGPLLIAHVQSQLRSDIAQHEKTQREMEQRTPGLRSNVEPTRGFRTEHRELKT